MKKHSDLIKTTNKIIMRQIIIIQIQTLVELKKMLVSRKTAQSPAGKKNSSHTSSWLSQPHRLTCRSHQLKTTTTWRTAGLNSQAQWPSGTSRTSQVHSKVWAEQVQDASLINNNWCSQWWLTNLHPMDSWPTRSCWRTSSVPPTWESSSLEPRPAWRKYSRPRESTSSLSTRKSFPSSGKRKASWHRSTTLTHNST